jgi:hypothetical protein
MDENELRQFLKENLKIHINAIGSSIEVSLYIIDENGGFIYIDSDESNPTEDRF